MMPRCPFCKTEMAMARPSGSAKGNRFYFLRCVNSDCTGYHVRTQNRETEAEAMDDWPVQEAD